MHPNRKEQIPVKLSQAYIPTQKEVPSDAAIPSHQLMIRAGLIRPLAAGVYSYLPLGWKVMKTIMTIVREEMDAIGAQELQMPALNPAEIWDETGRNADFGDEIFRLKDRKNRPLLLAPTHEEIICDLARKFIRSYKDLPQMWYQIQTKFRDEPRPRSGVIRTRQFFMKDSYSLDSDDQGLEHSYRLHAQAYRKIFKRCGLDFHVVGASSGLMGGKVSQEFMFESPHGEDTLAICDNCGYAANIDVAVTVCETLANAQGTMEPVQTPGKRTIDEVSDFLNRPKTHFAKSLAYVAGGETVLILVRGDHDLNEAKLQSFLGAPARPAHPEEILAAFGTEPGFIGPVRLKSKIRILADRALQNQHDWITGANLKDTHLTGVEPDRDFAVSAYGDFRSAVSGDSCSVCGRTLRIVHAIELGHIFKLGTKYSSAMKANFLDSAGRENPVIMGSYGIGIERILAAAIEQGNDDRGIIWNQILTPYQVHVIPLKMDNPEIVQLADAVYSDLRKSGFDCLMDDRTVSPGFKFKDADLIGIPIQVIIGDKWLKERLLEIKDRKTGAKEFLSGEDLVPFVRKTFSA
jgi:prolyl-tRNA synthetase